jgi:hypothetical protein
MMVERSQCVGCGRDVLWDAAEYTYWETLHAQEMCPSCLAGGEEQAGLDESPDGPAD